MHSAELTRDARVQHELLVAVDELFDKARHETVKVLILCANAGRFELVTLRLPFLVAGGVLAFCQLRSTCSW